MQRLKLHRPTAIQVRPLLAALAATAGCSAWADEPSPYYIGVTQSVVHDSNVYRTPDGRGDTYGATGLVGGFDQSIGRQRVFGDLNLRNNTYAREKTLDNVSYGVTAGWDWATIEKLSGGVLLNVRQGLATYDNNSSAQPTLARNILKTEQFAARVRWGGTGVLNLNSAYSYSHVDYSETPASESAQHTGSIGASYRIGPTLRLGTALRLSRNVQPKALQSAPGVFEENKVNGRYLDLTADWLPSVQTGLNARLSWTRQTNSGVSDRDFSGLTGGLNASYAPTAKLAFSASLSRDTGANSSFFNLTNPTTGQSTASVAENDHTYDSLALGATYAATAKIGVNAGVGYRHGRIKDQVLIGNLVSTDERNDNTSSASIGASYAIARNWSLGCNFEHLKRDVSGFIPYAYDANVFSCTAQFVLR